MQPPGDPEDNPNPLPPGYPVPNVPPNRANAVRAPRRPPVKRSGKLPALPPPPPPGPIIPPHLSPTDSHLFATVLANLSDDRLDIFFKLFDYPRKSTREDRTQRFLTTTLPEILNFNSQTYNRNLMDILNVLNSGSPEQINHFKHPRLPQVFQRPPGAQPTFRLLLTSPVHIDHSTGSDRLTERTVIGRFLTVAGQPPARGSVTIDGADLLPVNFGEIDSVFLLNSGERKSKKSIILIDCPHPESLTWFVIQIGIPAAKFLTDFARKHGLPPSPDAPIICHNARCVCEQFELRQFLLRLRKTGIAMCPNCNMPMFLADIVPLDSIGRRETPPAAPPGQGQGQPAAPGRRSKPLPVPVTEKVQAVPVIHASPLQWQPIPVADESPEEREVRWGAAMIMMTALKGRADPKGFLRAIPPCDPAVEEWQLPVMDPEDDYGGAIREIEKFC